MIFDSLYILVVTMLLLIKMFFCWLTLLSLGLVSECARLYSCAARDEIDLLRHSPCDRREPTGNMLRQLRKLMLCGCGATMAWKWKSLNSDTDENALNKNSPLCNANDTLYTFCCSHNCIVNICDNFRAWQVIATNKSVIELIQKTDDEPPSHVLIVRSRDVITSIHCERNSQQYAL